MKIIMPRTIVRMHQDMYNKGLRIDLRWPDINKQWHWVVGDREIMDSPYGGHQVEVPAFEYEAAVAMDHMSDVTLHDIPAYWNGGKKKKEEKKGNHVDWLDSQVDEVRKVGTKELV